VATPSRSSPIRSTFVDDGGERSERRYARCTCACIYLYICIYCGMYNASRACVCIYHAGFSAVKFIARIARLWGLRDSPCGIRRSEERERERESERDTCKGVGAVPYRSRMAPPMYGANFRVKPGAARMRPRTRKRNFVFPVATLISLPLLSLSLSPSLSPLAVGRISRTLREFIRSSSSSRLQFSFLAT